jgi:hypothetical protein
MHISITSKPPTTPLTSTNQLSPLAELRIYQAVPTHPYPSPSPRHTYQSTSATNLQQTLYDTVHQC